MKERLIQAMRFIMFQPLASGLAALSSERSLAGSAGDS